MMQEAAFALFAALTLSSAAGVVLLQDPWHSALMLGVSLLSVAAHYVMLTAEFIAVIQVLVYVGGVLVLISFVVMLTQIDDGETPGEETEVMGR